MNIKSIAARSGFQVAGRAALERKPKADDTKKPGQYGNSANGKAGGILKLAIKWAENDRDEETRKVMTQVVVAIKGVIWDHLSEKKQKELLEL
jgi:hypothetical protein